MQDRASNNKRIAKNTAFLYVRMIFVLLVSLYSTRVILNVLGVEDFGVYNVVGGFVSLFFFINSTMSNSVQRYYNFEKGKGAKDAEKSVYNTSLHIQLLLCLILLGILETIGLWYVNSQMVIPESRIFAANVVYQCSVCSMLVTLLQIPYSASIIAHEKMDFYAIVSITDVVIKLLIILIIPYLPGDKLIIYSSLLLATCIFIFIVNFSYSRRNFTCLKYDGTFRKDLFKEMISFMGWNVFDMFAFSVKSQGGNLVINAFFGPLVNAARGVSVQIMNAVQAFSVNVLTAFRPQLVEAYAQDNHARITNMMNVMTKISYTVFLALSLPIILEINYILKLWLGTDVPEYTQAFTILCLLDMLVCSLNTPLTFVSQATGNIKRYNVVRSILIISIIPLSIIANQWWPNPTAVFWISFIIAIINQPVSMILLHKIYPYSYIEYSKSVIIPCIVLSVLVPIVPCIIHLFFEESFLRLIFTVTADVSGIIVFGLIIILKPEERQYLYSFIKKKIS